MKYFRNIILSILVVSIISVIVPTKAFAVSDSDKIEYPDIKGSWCEKWAGLYGYEDIFSGEDGCFHPNQNITRMELVRLLHKVLNIHIYYNNFASTDISGYYDDVPSDSVGASDLYDLITCGIIDTKYSFHPSETLDREEMIHFIMNAFYYVTGNDYAIPDLAIQFTDASEISSEYYTDVNHSVTLGLVNGVGNHFISPCDKATRAEAVTIVGQLAELRQKYKSDVNVKASAEETDGKLSMTLAIVNNADKSVTVQHKNGQIFDFVIRDQSGGELYRWSKGKMFPMMVMSTDIAPGEEVIFFDSLDQTIYSSIKDKINSIKAYIEGTSSDFTIYTDGYLISIPFSINN